MRGITNNKRAVSLPLMAALSLCGTATTVAQTKSPNVLFIFIDDLGVSDLNFLGHKQFHTPNIDRLASEGIYFSEAYSAAPVSSPTRASLISGQSPAQLQLTCHIPGVKYDAYIEKMSREKNLREADFRTCLELTQPSIADVMKSAGYRTAFIGKWHLAGEGSSGGKSLGVIAPEYHPENFGFDINIGGCGYGQPASYFSPYKNATIKDGEVGEYLTDRLTNEAINYISEDHESPFFLLLSYYTVHTPYQVPEHIVDRNAGDRYSAMIEKMDENVGRLLTSLDELGLSEDTLVIFYSDNGGLLPNPPYSGIKGELLEGGIRVPMIVRWSGVTPAGSRCEEPVTTIDFYPTLAEFAGFEGVSADPSSRSLKGLITTESKEIKPRSLYWYFPHHRVNSDWTMGRAIRRGDYKLIHIMESDSYFLYNLTNDIGEQNNLFSQESQLSAQMLKELDEWQKNVGAVTPVKN